jgi:Holliday junction resolvasome RuvABC endonuclease subunit
MPMPSEVFTHLGIPYPKDRDKKKQEALDWVKDNLYVALSKDEDDKADAICIAFAAKQAANKLLS